MCPVLVLVALGSIGHGEPGGSCAESEVVVDLATTWRGDLGLRAFAPDLISPKTGTTEVAEYLSRAQLEEDLDQFQSELEERFAYLRYNEPDYHSAIQAIRGDASDGMSVDDFDIELTKVLALFIDGHSVVAGGSFPEGYLPFHMERIGERHIAIRLDRSDFVDPSYPYITRVDGKTIDEWYEELLVLIPKGSPSYVSHFSLRYLEFIRFARSIAGIDDPDVVEVELESEDGSSRVTTMIDVDEDYPAYDQWPSTQSGFIDGNIGYLRLTRWFDEGALDEINTWMPQFADTRGIIVDLRDNRGGTRNIFRELYPYFVTHSDLPMVANAAKYRLYSAFPYDYLSGRYMYRENWGGWSPAERAAIADFMETFEPEWAVPESEFSDWHFWLLSKASRPDAYRYRGRIIFLMDKRCWSASDVVLSAVKGMRNVTLIGEPSIGASGARIITTLRNSGLDLYLSSMASFQKTGELYETNGVQPDVYLEPLPEYYLQGGPDTTLDFAVRSFDRVRRPDGRVASPREKDSGRWLEAPPAR
jgi:hypothetical protein